MTNLITRPTTSASTATQTPVLEPFRMMRDLLRWDPFRDASWTLMEPIATFSPNFEVKETPSAYIFKADMPGMKEEDLDIQLLNNRLTISGKRESERKEDNETYHLYERSYGNFSRTFTVPEDMSIDKVDAHLVNGVLTLTVLKNPEAQPRKIHVKG
jgi:HSP20 family protein